MASVGVIKLKITSNLNELKALLEKAEGQWETLKETLKEIGDFKIEIGTETVKA